MVREVVPNDPELSDWRPQSYEEWAGQQRLRAILTAWSAQVTHERTLRGRLAATVFVLITIQIVAVLTYVYLDAFAIIKPSTDIARFLIPSVFAEIIGLAFAVVKYIFSESLRVSFDQLAGRIQ